MRIVRSIAGMQAMGRRWQRQGVLVGLVPTMGYLHAGHISLADLARKQVGPRGKVVISIYVNPTQFSPTEDFCSYPRNLERDTALCRRHGVDVIFAPSDAGMYPADAQGNFSTYVTEGALSLGMEGQSRPTHFRGVTTVVAKLFNIVQPQYAVFGAKDFQQAAVVTRMVRDLNFPLKIVVAPIYREPDGVAMSSRNKYLAGDLRTQAQVLWRSIKKAQAEVRASRNGITAARLVKAVRGIVSAERDARLDYVEFFNPKTLKPVVTVTRGTQMALAVFVGKTRLIDNARL